MERSFLMNKKVFHIRRRLKRYKGNQFYKDKNNRYAGTYCGADPTDHDISWYQKSERFLDWFPCSDCINKRMLEDGYKS